MTERFCCRLRREFNSVWDNYQQAAVTRADDPADEVIDDIWRRAETGAPAVTALRGLGVTMAQIFEVLSLINCGDHRPDPDEFAVTSP